MNTTNSNIENRFETMRRRILKHGIKSTESKINMARDKEYARNHHLCSILNFDFAKLSEDEQLIISEFDFDYKLGYNVEETFNKVKGFIKSTLNDMQFARQKLNSTVDNDFGASEYEEFSLKLNSRIVLFNTCSDEDKLLRFLAKNYAMLDLREYFEAQVGLNGKIANELSERRNNAIKPSWTGSKIDFIKLVYGCYHSKILNNGEGEITKLVEKLAYEFNVKLGPGWQADFSNSRTRANLDTNHYEVFAKAQNGLKKYFSLKDDLP